ncbi:metallophosphoesterase 1 isoform X2 [Cephus cinctus]|uniref:Metallophosphoesterase 1 isoform X2 n=1 Tax=Cephus cinctus TaxID=211228 RepID=A0AAJ7FRK6_CEPCN|nr:metallophosphoesterase 1 isoform X2 [Cephus cinctus]XP_015604778.1 metallophosphoesterase 1 isoform X2 [Cephus cinctus]
MITTKYHTYKQYVLVPVLAMLGLLVFCEYLIYYVVLFQCKWPVLDPNKIDRSISPPTVNERPVRAMFLADTHLLGSRKGHWFDKLRREWQMYRTFQTVMKIHKPDVVFVLGDVFDEGQWCSSAEFDYYVRRFHSLFSVPKNSHLYVIAGNHDIGFHHVITPYLNERFVKGMKSPNLRRISIRGNHFVLLNSMALEGDGCFLCRPTEVALNKIAKHLRCSKGVGSDCSESNAIKTYSRPILLQHYPMYRESDEMCNEWNPAPDDIKDIKFRERWECLSKEASEQLLDILSPRLVIDGHTHHGCKRIHRDNILEVTVPSFSWRNKANPSFLLNLLLFEFMCLVSFAFFSIWYIKSEDRDILDIISQSFIDLMGLNVFPYLL